MQVRLIYPPDIEEKSPGGKILASTEMLKLIHLINSIGWNIVEKHFKDHYEGKARSLSRSIESLLNSELLEQGWRRNGDSMLPDYIKGDIALDVAFDHANVCARNLLKLSIAKRLQPENFRNIELFVIVTASEQLKKAGNFDPAILAIDILMEHSVALSDLFGTPLVFLVLQNPENFFINNNRENGRNIGRVVRLV